MLKEALAWLGRTARDVEGRDAAIGSLMFVKGKASAKIVMTIFVYADRVLLRILLP
jgi:hypothetical protein